MWVLGKNFVYDIIVGLERPKGIFFLDQIKSQSFIPIYFAYFGKDFFVLLRTENFQPKEDNSNTKVRIFYFEFSLHFIQHFKILSFWMDLSQISFSIVFCQLACHWPELNSIVAVFNEFFAYVFHVGSEMVESEQNCEECNDFLFKQNPELHFLVCIFTVIFLIEHGDVGHKIDQIVFSLVSLSEFLHWDPFAFFCLLFSADFKLCFILTEVNDGIIDDELSILR